MKMEVKKKKRNIYWWLQIGVTVWMAYQLIQIFILLYMVIFTKETAKFTAGMLGLTFPYSSDNFEMQMYFIILPLAILQLLVLWYARGFLKNLSNNVIFSMQNADYLRNTGIVFFIQAVFGNIMVYLSGKELFHFLKQEPEDIINTLITYNWFIFKEESLITTLPKGDVTFSFDFQVWGFITAIAILIISMLFRKAVKVAQENELTI
ncbi:DUF2975 domain-containing protein [Priestia taiwanensis]|nr:DUF2975 domain-containing protein [Priestia taiwanensis]